MEAPRLSVGDVARRRCVLVATPFVWEGGRGRGKPTVHNVLEGFGRAGYDVHVLCGTNQPDLRLVRRDGYTLHYFAMRAARGRFAFDADRSYLTAVRGERRRWMRHPAFRLWWLEFVLRGSVLAVRLARSLRPALAYGINNPGVPVAVAAARAGGVPAIARVMGTEIAQFAGLTPGVPLQRQARPGLRVWARLLLVRFDELLVFRLPCAAWVITDDGQIGAEELTDWLGVPPERLLLWRNGVDRQRFAAAPELEAARARLGLAPEDRVVLWVSQLTDWKHTERLLEAMPAVLATVPGALALIVGDGPERGALEKRAAELGVMNRVRLDGFVTHDAMPVYYRAADVFVALYDRANVANTLLEAMLAGLPAVTLDNGLTRSVVHHETNGLLVSPEHLGQVADALVRVLTDEPLRQRLARAASRWADESLLEWPERIDREIATIEAIAARGSR